MHVLAWLESDPLTWSNYPEPTRNSRCLSDPYPLRTRDSYLLIGPQTLKQLVIPCKQIFSSLRQSQSQLSPGNFEQAHGKKKPKKNQKKTTHPSFSFSEHPFRVT